MSDFPSLFTPTSARSALRDIRPLAERIRELYRSLDRRRKRAPGIRAEQPVDPEYFALAAEMNRLLDRLRGMGVVLQDFEQGWVDFPARRAGRAVYLCWQVGEENLGFWHSIAPAHGPACSERREAAPGSSAVPLGRIPLDGDGPWETGAPLDDSGGLA